jgi:hypothetical protein
MRIARFAFIELNRWVLNHRPADSVIMPAMGWMRHWLARAAVVTLLSGCQSNSPPPRPVGPGGFISAQVLRGRDDAGLPQNDARSITSPDELAHLESFFPDIGTRNESTLHDAVQPWIVVRFRNSAGTETYAISDYRIYKIDTGTTGDFVVAPGFINYVQRIFNAPQ